MFTSLRLLPSFSTVSAAVRAIPPQNFLSRTIHSQHPKLFGRKFPNFVSRNFSANVDNPTTDDRKHVEASRSEIKSKQLPLQQRNAPVPPPDFPFEIIMATSKSIMMERIVDREKIQVFTAMPTIVRQEQVGGGPPKPVDLIVKVVKEGEGEAVFEVSMCPHLLQVHSAYVRVKEPATESDGEEEVKVEGELECGLEKYLKARGIEPRYAEFLYKYIVWRCVPVPLMKFFKE